MKTTDLSSFSNPEYHHGKSLPVRLVWMLVSRIFFQTVLPYPSAFKAMLLRLFGAKIGKRVVIKPNVNFKQPWRLSIGAYSWIGEGVWIDNLVQVSIESNVCISQGAFLLTGNHNYKTSSFDLTTGAITLEEGVWIGAKSIVGPNVIESEEHAIKRGAPILAEIAGYGSSDDAFHITHPAPEGLGAFKAMNRALEDSSISSADIDYINAHGTSTPFNDKNESKAIGNLFKDSYL